MSAQGREKADEWLAVMLGWRNVPPRRTLEDNIRALVAGRENAFRWLGNLLAPPIPEESVFSIMTRAILAEIGGQNT